MGSQHPLGVLGPNRISGSNFLNYSFPVHQKSVKGLPWSSEDEKEGDGSSYRSIKQQDLAEVLES